jgi:hypothetical protein
MEATKIKTTEACALGLHKMCDGCMYSDRPVQTVLGSCECPCHKT